MPAMRIASLDAEAAATPIIKLAVETTGIGIEPSMLHQIVLSHGGTLDVHSADDTTTFVMRLPRRTTERQSSASSLVDAVCRFFEGATPSPGGPAQAARSWTSIAAAMIS